MVFSVNQLLWNEWELITMLWNPCRMFSSKVVPPLSFGSMEYQQLFRVIAYNSQYVVFNKAPGVAVQNDDIRVPSHRRQQGLFNLLKEVDPSLRPVHRLDKVVSGGLIMARNKSSAQKFSRNLQKGGNYGYPFIRRYAALVNSKELKYSLNVHFNTETTGVITVPVEDNSNQHETTKFMIPGERHKGRSLILLELLTGKKHQIRRALAREFNSAILNDRLYGAQDCCEGLRGSIALHSSFIRTRIGQTSREHFIPVQYAHELWDGFIDSEGNFSERIQGLLTQFWE